MTDWFAVALNVKKPILAHVAPVNATSTDSGPMYFVALFNKPFSVINL